jgi:hypothetical protein
MVRYYGYYGYYSNVSRGRRKKQTGDTLIPSILEPEDLKPNRTWARLIQKIGACPRLDRGRLIP